MAKPRNDDRRTKIRSLYDALLPDYTTKRAVITKISEETGIPERTVQYYLTDHVASAKHTEYSDLIKQRVALMELTEIKQYAIKIGRPWQRLYQISLDARKPQPPVKVDARREEIVNLWKSFNFTSNLDLQVFGFTLADVRAAKKILREKWGLSLAAPNLLVHAAGNKCYALNYQEQATIIKRPVAFINTNAIDIGANWKPYDETQSLAQMLGLDGEEK